MALTRGAFLAVALAWLLGACAGGGAGGGPASGVPEPRPGDLIIGQTTPDDARRMFGTPTLDSSFAASDPRAYSTPDPAVPGGARPPQFRPVSVSGQMTAMTFADFGRSAGNRRKLMMLRFWNDKLVEHVLLVEGTTPDGFLVAPTAADAIVAGRTTEAEIRTRFGVPLAESVYPRVAGPDHRMLGFIGMPFGPSGQRQARMLFVLIDRNGVVVDHLLQTNNIVSTRRS